MSSALTAVLLPVAMWGLLSSLLLELIALRNVFIGGGDTKLRIATVSFAAGVVLIQRLASDQGKSTAAAYGLALGGSMLLFAAVHAFQWTVGFPPLYVFGANVALLGALWWIGHRLTSACAADEANAALAGESGVFSARRKAEAIKEKQEGMRAPHPIEAGIDAIYATESSEDASPSSSDVRSIYETEMSSHAAKRAENRKRRRAENESGKLEGGKWRPRLAGLHPGRSLLGFALIAMPVFGIGQMLGGDRNESIRLGIRLFMYLWCTLTLLWLAGLGQMRAYFRHRELTLPEGSGLAWIGIGTLAVAIAMLAAFIAPQPASPGRDYVRARIEAVYRGPQSRRGIPERARNAQGEGSGGAGSEQAEEGGSQPQPGGSDGKSGGGEASAANARRESAQPPPPAPASNPLAGESTGRLFDVFLRFLVWSGAFVAVLLALAAAFLGWKLVRTRMGLRKLKTPAKQRRPVAVHSPAFSEFGDPSAIAGAEELVRYLWSATLARLADLGLPPPAHATPTEIVEDKQWPLHSILYEARWLAGLYGYCEYSGRKLDDAVMPELRTYWTKLKGTAELR